MSTALLMLEFQNDYYPNGRIPLERSLEATAKAEAVLRLCREKKIPVFHLLHSSTDPEAQYMLPCTTGEKPYATVQPTKNETIIKKHYPNGFKDTGLLNQLIKNKINHLVICGMMTQGAVDATVRAAHDLGFVCTVLHDACAAKQLEFNHTAITAQNVHYAFLAALHPTYATVLASEEFLQRSGARIAVAAAVA